MTFRRRSAFHDIRVTQSGSVRTLSFGDTTQSTMRIGNEADEGLAYVELFHLPLILRKELSTALFIGLGGATGPRQFLSDYPQMTLDVVEIDAAVIELAREHFGFSASDRARVHEADGRTFLSAATRSWDLIIVDAYGVEDGELVIPRELTTKTFFTSCARRLSPGGFVVFNCAAPATDALTGDIETTLKKVFSGVAVFGVGNANNSVLLATNGPLEKRTAHLVALAKNALRSGAVRRKSLVKYCRELRW